MATPSFPRSGGATGVAMARLLYNRHPASPGLVLVTRTGLYYRRLPGYWLPAMPQLMLSHTHSWSTVTVVLVLTVRHQARHLTNQMQVRGHVT